MTDLHPLQRFIDAQAPVYGQVLQELRSGNKRSHWMWFVFPQLKGLGHSAMAHHFGIGSRVEALAYVQHPVLGLRLRECTRLVMLIEGQTIHEIFGYPDDLKFHSSMTLFAQVTSGEPIFMDALNKYFAGQLDAETMRLLG